MGFKLPKTEKELADYMGIPVEDLKKSLNGLTLDEFMKKNGLK